MMLKKRIAVMLISTVFSMQLIAQPCFAFPSILDDVPEKQILTTQTTAGSFSDENVKRAFKLLNYVGVINEDAKDFMEDEPVSRAYAVSAFGAILAGATPSGNAQSFSDVPATHVYAAGIKQAMDCGVINYGNGKFYPNKNVSYEDIAQWALRVINFDFILVNKNPITIADEFDFFKGIKRDSDSVTCGQFMRILENVLNSKYVEMQIGAKGTEFKVSETETFLGKKYNIYVQDGILTAYKYSSLYGDISLKDNRVQINRAEYEILEELSVDCVGCNVSAYIDGDSYDTIITLWKDEKKNVTCEINRENYDTFELSQIKYDRSKRINLDDNVRLMRNNLFDGYYSSDVIDSLPQTDKIVVLDNDGDGKGDLIKVYKYTHYLVKSVSTMGESLAFANGGGTLDVSEDSESEFFFEGNEVNPLSDLKANDILTVLEGVKGDGQRVFSAIVSRDVAEGDIARNGTDEIGPYYVIDNKTYYLSDELQAYMNANSTSYSPGTYIQAYIGTDNKIVFIKTEDDFLYGYVMNAAYDSGTEEAIITIYTEGGNVKKLGLAEKVRVYNSENQNGKAMKIQNAYNEFYSNGVIKNEAIAYTLNSEDMVTRVAFAIDRTAEKPDTISYPLTLDLNYTPLSDSDSSARMYRGILASKYVMNGTTPVFIVPAPETGLTKDEKQYQMTTGGKWSLEKYFGPSEIIKAYNCDKFYKPQFYVINGEVTSNISQGDGKVHFYVIDKVSDVYNEEEACVEKAISYYDNTTYKTVSVSKDVAISKAGYYCDVTDATQLKRGDVIQVHINSVGQIDVMTVYFRISEHSSKAMGMYYYDDQINKTSAVYTTDVSSAMPNVGVVYGKVKDSEGNRVILETVSEVESPVSVAGSVYGNAYFIIYDTQLDIAKPADFAEIQPDDIVVMRKYYNHVQDVIIIR